jgi:predicted nucleotidyltransferase
MNSIYHSDKMIVQNYVDRAKVALPGVIQYAYWFGSRARGMAHPDSDYDLLLETEEELTETQRDLLADIAIDLAAEHGSLLDVHFYSYRQLQDHKIARSPFVQVVHQEGILL